LSQGRVAAAASVSRAWLSKFERNGVSNPGVVTVARVFAVVGLDLSARAYPSEAGALRDAGQVRVLGRFRQKLHPSLRFRTEVPFPIPGDQRAWDATLTPRDNSWRYGVEVEVHPVDGQAITRRAALKRRDGGMDGVIMVLPDTRQTRAFMREFGPLLAQDFQIKGPAALAHLAAGEDPGGSAVVVV
jgi:hypothetical protein